MQVQVFIGTDTGNKKENSQINRIMATIIKWAKEVKLENIWFLRNVNYYHEGLGAHGNKMDWNGEIDLLFISKNCFVIFELKNKKGIIKGYTQNGTWEIKYHDSKEFIQEKNHFIQCSKMKTFFSQNYYPKKVLPKIKRDYKLRPDVALVFLNGSDTSNIVFTPPVKFHTDEYYKILENINEEDKNFMENNFIYLKNKDLMIVNNKQERIDLIRLKKILNSCNYEDRISKWFHVLTEDKIDALLLNFGSDSFEFDTEIMNILISDFKLKIIDEYVA